MAVTPDDAGEERLPCGAAVSELFDQVADGHDAEMSAHQVGCAHCRAFLAEIGELWAPVRQLAAERVSAPPGMVAAVMSRVRELAREVWYAALPADRGTTRIAARVVGVIARRAAAGVPGVKVVLGRSTDPAEARTTRQATDRHAYPGTAVGVAGGRVAIDLALAVAYGLPIPEVSARVQQTVVSHVRAATGVTDVEVNVTVDDVLGT